MELWDILDGDGRKTGGVVERGKPLRDGEYHLVVDVWIKNNQGEYLISRRAQDKFPDPCMWEPTCGCAVAGDDSLSAALREVREELGISLNPAFGRRIKRFMRAGVPDIFDVWLFVQEVDINAVVLQPGETDAAMWADASKILALAKDGQFLPGVRVPYLQTLLDGTLLPPLLRPRAACFKTRNIDAMITFYTNLFAQAPEVDGGVDFRFYDGRLVVFKLTDTETPSTQNAALIYETEDADAEYERLAMLGVTCEPPSDKPWGVRSLVVMDPDGNAVSIAAPLRTTNPA